MSGKSPEDLIAEFRNSYNPRIAVTVDMIATGTDIKPLEVLLFMRSVKSRVLYEQMIGRGTRVISDNDLSIVTKDAGSKHRFVIVDAVGVTENPKFDTQTLERKRHVPFPQLLQAVATGMIDADTLSSLAGRLAMLDRKLTEQDRYDVEAVSGGLSLNDLSNRLLDAVDPDVQFAAAQEATGEETPSPEAVAQAAAELQREAAKLLAANPRLRETLITIHQRNEQVIDDVTVDVLKEAGFDAAATERARSTVDSFRQFIEEHKDEITALELLYSRPYGQRQVTYADIKELASYPPAAAPQLDHGAALAGLCPGGAGQGAGHRSQAHADRHHLAGAPCGAGGGRAGPLSRGGAPTLCHVAGGPGGCRPHLHAGAALVAGPHRRADRAEPDDRAGGLRLRRLL